MNNSQSLNSITHQKSIVSDIDLSGSDILTLRACTVGRRRRSSKNSERHRSKGHFGLLLEPTGSTACNFRQSRRNLILAGLSDHIAYL